MSEHSFPGFVALGAACAKLDTLEALSPILIKRTELGKEKDRVGLMGAPVALVASGMGCLAYGTGKYLAVIEALKKRTFMPNVAGVLLVSVTSAIIAGGAGVAVRRESKEGKEEM
ncbi:hypothetical protein ACMFMG_009929 [Clarireedia jacksonii]